MLQNLVIHAESKFGEVYAVEKQAEGLYKLLIKRNAPVFEHKPFMTIRGFINDDKSTSFEHGHYDLNRDRAFESFKTR